jgi:metal-responsive CopG/Arc/MetJ family transcriptional regulator
MPDTRKSRVFTISLPPELADKAEAMAQRDSRTMSELFREAFRAYLAQDIRRVMDDIGAYAETRNPHGYTEEDIPRLIQEVRAGMRAEEEAKKKTQESLRLRA